MTMRKHQRPTDNNEFADEFYPCNGPLKTLNLGDRFCQLLIVG